MTNEELVERIQGGDKDAVEELIKENQGFLYSLAHRFTNNYDLLRDLKQEGAIAIIKASGNFNPQRGSLFLTYATPAVQAAMQDLMARMSGPIALPTARYNQLRQVRKLITGLETEDKEYALQELISVICSEMEVSEQVAWSLLRDYDTVFQVAPADRQWEQNVSYFDTDPAKVYEQQLLLECIAVAFDSLSPRERMLIQQHLGLEINGVGMTFQELAVRLNFNGHSAAEKAYKRAVESLRRELFAGKYGEFVRAKQVIANAKRIL